MIEASKTARMESGDAKFVPDSGVPRQAAKVERVLDPWHLGLSDILR